MWSEDTKKGLAVRIIFNKNGRLITKENLPSYMASFAQPEFIK
jgi:hypothetical protein